MTIEERIKHILRKYEDTKFSRARFFWKYLEEYHGVKFYITRQQFNEFWKDFASVERKLRDVLKTPEFKLEPKADSKRYEKSANFKEQYAKKEKNVIFGRAVNHLSPIQSIGLKP